MRNEGDMMLEKQMAEQCLETFNEILIIECHGALCWNQRAHGEGFPVQPRWQHLHV